MEERIIGLEIKATFTDHKLKELSEVVFEQSQVIDKLKSQLKYLNEQFQSGGAQCSLENEVPPPHY